MKTVSVMKELLEQKKLDESFSKVYTEDAFATQYERFLAVLESLKGYMTIIFGFNAANAD